jgi:hypothetical protein
VNRPPHGFLGFLPEDRVLSNRPPRSFKRGSVLLKPPSARLNWTGYCFTPPSERLLHFFVFAQMPDANVSFVCSLSSAAGLENSPNGLCALCFAWVSVSYAPNPKTANLKTSNNVSLFAIYPRPLGWKTFQTAFAP